MKYLGLFISIGLILAVYRGVDGINYNQFSNINKNNYVYEKNHFLLGFCFYDNL